MSCIGVIDATLLVVVFCCTYVHDSGPCNLRTSCTLLNHLHINKAVWCTIQLRNNDKMLNKCCLSFTKLNSFKIINHNYSKPF